VIDSSLSIIGFVLAFIALVITVGGAISAVLCGRRDIAARVNEMENLREEVSLLRERVEQLERTQRMSGSTAIAEGPP